MKIRIKDNTIRFRLTQSEVTELGQKGIVSSFTQFVDSKFIYAIEKTEDHIMSATFVGNRIVIKIPLTWIEELVSTDVVGFDGQDGPLKLLIEKDFACIDNSLEDQSDNYPNPNIKC